MEDQKYLCKSKIIERGWTDQMIKKFLGSPDAESLNPFYKNGPTVKLYLIDKVIDIEQTEEFKSLLESTHKKAKVEVSTEKVQEMIDYVNNINIDIPVMDLEDLYEKACEAYNNFQDWQSCEYEDWFTYKPLTTKTTKNFLNKVAINYLKYVCVQYIKHFDALYGRTGTIEAYNLLKQKINDKILETYPQLKRE